MAKLFKFLFKLIILVIFLLALGIGYIVFFVNPNTYKPQITQYFQKTTGQELVINGPLHWGFYPHLSVKITDAQINNPKNFSQSNPFVKINTLAIQIKLLPLLKKQFSAAKIILNQPVINLIENKSGQANWPSIENKNDRKNTENALLFAITHMEVNNGEIHWLDQKNNAHWTLTNLYFDIHGDNNKLFLNNLSGLFNNNKFSGNFVLENNTGAGKFQLSKLILNKLSLSNITVPIKLTKNNLNFSPITAKAYGGNLNTNLNINTSGNIPTYKITTKLNHFQVRQLTQNKVTGIGNFSLKATSSGLSTQQFKQNLNGSGSIELQNGTITTVNIHNFIETAIAFVTKQAAKTNNEKGTGYKNINGNYMIRNGVIANKDLSLTSQQITATGSGTADLNNNGLDFYISATPLHKKLNYTVPIIIKGTIDNPKYQLDLTKLALVIIKNKAHDIKKEVDKAVKSNFGSKEREEYLKKLNLKKLFK